VLGTDTQSASAKHESPISFGILTHSNSFIDRTYPSTQKQRFSDSDEQYGFVLHSESGGHCEVSLQLGNKGSPCRESKLSVSHEIPMKKRQSRINCFEK